MIELQKTSTKESTASSLAIATEEPTEAFLSVLQSKLEKDDVPSIAIKTVDRKNLSNETDDKKTILEKLLNTISANENKEELNSLLKTIGLDKGEQEAIIKLLNKKTAKIELSESIFQKNTKTVIEKNSILIETPKIDLKDSEKIDIKTAIKDIKPIDLKTAIKDIKPIDLKTDVKDIKPIDLKTDVKDIKPVDLKTDVKDIKPVDLKTDIKAVDVKIDTQIEIKNIKNDVKSENQEIQTKVATETKLPTNDIKALIKLFEHLQKSINQSTKDMPKEVQKVSLLSEIEESTKKPMTNSFVEESNEPKILIEKLKTLTKEIDKNIEIKIEQPKVNIETKTNKIEIAPQIIDESTQAQEKLFTFLEKLVKDILPEIKTAQPVALPVKQIIEAIKVEPKVVEELKEQKISAKNEKNLLLLLSLPKSDYKEKVIKSVSDNIVEHKEIEPADVAVEIAIEKHIETFKSTPILQIKKESVEQTNEKVPEKEFVSEKLIQLVPQKNQDNFSKEIIKNAKNYLEQQLIDIEVKNSEKPTLGSLVKLAVANNIDVQELTIKDVTPKENIQKMVENIFSPKVLPVNVRPAQSGQIMISREKNSTNSEKTSKTTTHTTPLAQLLNLSEQTIETVIVKTTQTVEQMINKKANSTELEALSEELNLTTEQSKRDLGELNVKESIKVEARANTQESAKSMIGHFSTSLKEAVKDYRPPFQRLHMKLNPEKLGSVDVTIIQRGQQLHINVSANQVALNMMNAQASELRTQLNSAGFGDASMEFNQQQDGNKEQQKQEQHQQQQNRFTNYSNNSDEETAISSLELVMANYF